MMREEIPMIRFYFLTNRRFEQLLRVIKAVWIGFWLGVLDTNALHTIDKYCYDSWSEYRSAGYNRKGLTEWEEGAIKTYFQDCKRLLVAATGGGREVLALCQLKFEVDGFECHPELAAFARALIQEEGSVANIDLVPRDECPQNDRQYDGLIIGWAAYMLIQSRQKRVAFLRQMRTKVPLNAPLLVSFYHREPAARRFLVIALVGNIFRRILGRNRIEVGDILVPFYAHMFTEVELEAELRQAGFDLAFYNTEQYGHAVAIASDMSVS